MFEISKKQFGLFLSALRKEKGYTQKDLAIKLYISDKAVSKWERGLSLPDISLLIPLADILDISVTELLEGKRMEKTSEMNAAQAESLVRKALSFSEKTPAKTPEQKRKHLLIFILCTAAAAFEWLACFLFRDIYKALLFKESILTMQALGLIFSAYFLIRAKERLPDYYDENKISGYHDGLFEINLPGIYFNNQNWPHILRIGRIWSVLEAAVFPLAGLLFGWLFPKIWMAVGFFAILAACLGMFLPMYAAARKYGSTDTTDMSSKNGKI